MRRKICLWLTALCLLGAGQAVLEPSMQYRGVLHAGSPLTGEDPGGLLVIRDQKAYQAFLDRIPTEEISPTRPAPPSDDPLLERPKVDFASTMVLVAYSGSMLTSVDIGQILLESDGNSVQVRVKRAPVEEMASVPYGVGNYHCVVLDRRDGKVTEVESH